MSVWMCVGKTIPTDSRISEKLYWENQKYQIKYFVVKAAKETSTEENRVAEKYFWLWLTGEWESKEGQHEGNRWNHMRHERVGTECSSTLQCYGNGVFTALAPGFF